MNLTTRCPKCNTVFQAGLSDLQLRKGYIRCIQCAHIFDGYAEVVSDAPDSAATPDLAAVPAKESLLSEQPGAQAPEASPPQVFRSARNAPSLSLQPHSTDTDAFHIGDLPLPVLRPEPRLGGWLEPSDSEATLPDFSVGSGLDRDAVHPGAQAEPFVVEARRDRQAQGGSAAPLLKTHTAPGWWAGVVGLGGRVLLSALVLLLAAQLVYVYRVQIAQAAPGLRPYLEQACTALHCQVPYARDIARIAITSSALKATDLTQAKLHADSTSEHNAQHFMLQLNLRNQAEYPQEWPVLVLDLNDAAGTLLVRRNLSAPEYLGATAASQAFMANSEVRIQVPLSLDGLQINGYQLDLFFP